MKGKISVCFCLLLAALAFFFPEPVRAAEHPVSEESLASQLEKSGANDLPDRLPKETADSLEEIGVHGVNLEELENVTPSAFFNVIFQGLAGKLPSVLKIFFSILAVILLSAVVASMKLSFGEQPVGGVINLVGMLCVAFLVITPVVGCIGEAAAAVSGGAYFMLGCVPVMVGFLIATGQPAAGTSFSVLLLSLCNGISFLAAHLIVPVLNIFLGFSTVSSISPNISLDGISKSFYSAMKWILGLSMTVFSGLLTVQGLLGGAVDVTTNKSVKFVVSSFVPVVGTALGEAFGTVHNCAKVLRSGVGAFGILGLVFLFLPIVLQCVLWSVSLNLSAGISDVFALKEIGGLLRSIAKVISMLIAVLLCCVVMLIVSLEIMMLTGGGSA